MCKKAEKRMKYTYPKLAIYVVLICICFIISGCAISGSPVPTLEEQVANIDDSLLDLIGVLPLHTYYTYELLSEEKSTDSYTSKIRFSCTEGMFLVDGALELHYTYDREWGSWRFENATFDYEKQPNYFQCDIEGIWVWEGVTTRDLNAWEEYGEEVKFLIYDYVPSQVSGDGYGTFQWLVTNAWHCVYEGEGYISYSDRLRLLMYSDELRPGAFNINPITMRCSEYGMSDRDLVKQE